jgi:hypothetical protein
MIIALIEAQSYHKTHTTRSLDCILALGRVLVGQYTMLMEVADETLSGTCNICGFRVAVGHSTLCA